MYKKKEREIKFFMEKTKNEENPSLTMLYDELVFGTERVLKANAARMGNAQLIEFYDYCVEKSAQIEGENSNAYFYACILLEEMPTINMYKKGQLYVDTTLGNEDIPYMENVEVTQEDADEIDRIVELLEQRKKAKKNPIKKLVRFFGR